MFTRKPLQKLQNWRNSSHRKPLILRGARQVGKTTLVNMFAKSFDQYIYLNLDLLSDRKIFDENEDFDTLIKAIFFLKNANESSSQTLIFIDEIQNSPKAVSALRYFYEKRPDLFVIAAGSLLESLLNLQISFPVGRVEFMTIRPLTFEEFLIASENKNLVEAYNSIPFFEYAYDKLNEYFKTYLLIGGMPEVVDNYIKNNDFNKIKSIISNLVIAYKDDVEKYAETQSSKAITRHIIDNSFFYAGEKITFQGFGNSNYRSREVGESFRMLEKTMLLKLIYPVQGFGFPVIPDKRKKPRLQVLDTGLVNYLSGIEREIFQQKDILDTYKGRIAEHIVGQELLTLEINPDYTLNFWLRDKKQSSAELDYLLPFENKLYPIEVKSGSAGKLKSLNFFMENSDSDLAVRFYSGKLAVDNLFTSTGKGFRLINLPMFLTGKIKEYILWSVNQKLGS